MAPRGIFCVCASIMNTYWILRWVQLVKNRKRCVHLRLSLCVSTASNTYCKKRKSAFSLSKRVTSLRKGFWRVFLLLFFMRIVFHSLWLSQIYENSRWEAQIVTNISNKICNRFYIYAKQAAWTQHFYLHSIFFEIIDARFDFNSPKPNIASPLKVKSIETCQ